MLAASTNNIPYVSLQQPVSTHTKGDKQAQQFAANFFEGDTWIFAEDVTGRQPTCGTVRKIWVNTPWICLPPTGISHKVIAHIHSLHSPPACCASLKAAHLLRGITCDTKCSLVSANYPRKNSPSLQLNLRNSAIPTHTNRLHSDSRFQSPWTILRSSWKHVGKKGHEGQLYRAFSAPNSSQLAAWLHCYLPVAKYTQATWINWNLL